MNGSQLRESGPAPHCCSKVWCSAGYEPHTYVSEKNPALGCFSTHHPTSTLQPPLPFTTRPCFLPPSRYHRVLMIGLLPSEKEERLFQLFSPSTRLESLFLFLFAFGNTEFGDRLVNSFLWSLSFGLKSFRVLGIG